MITAVIQAILTGSRVYGKPGNKSDLDLVVLVNREQLKSLERACDGSGSNYPAGDGTTVSLVFGNLNLICVTDPVAFAVWLKGTRKLHAMSDDGRNPLTRDCAVEVLSAMRKRHGIQESDVG